MTPPLRHTPDAVYRDLAEGRGGVLLHLESADYVQLNDVAARVWNAIDGDRDEEAVVAAVRAQLPDAPDVLEDDVRRFIATLRERGLVQ